MAKARGVHASNGYGGRVGAWLGARSWCGQTGGRRPGRVRGARRGSATAAALRLAGKSWQQPAVRARARACRVAVNEMGRQGKGEWLPGQ